MRTSGQRLYGKTALVTGAANGIGKATAQLFARQGARIVASDIDKDAVETVVTDINAEHDGAAFAAAHDVTLSDSWAETLEIAVHHMGGLNVLINNAGVGRLASLEEEDIVNWQRTLTVNLDSVFLGCNMALSHLRQNAPSSIVNISSSAAFIGRSNLAAYNAAKAGVWMLTKSIAILCAEKKYDIRSNSIHPGYIETRILDPVYALGSSSEQVKSNMLREIPMKRLGEPLDVAYAALYLACDESRFVTGAEIKVDGGMTAV